MRETFCSATKWSGQVYVVGIDRSRRIRLWLSLLSTLSLSRFELEGWNLFTFFHKSTRETDKLSVILYRIIFRLLHLIGAKKLKWLCRYMQRMQCGISHAKQPSRFTNQSTRYFDILILWLMWHKIGSGNSCWRLCTRRICAYLVEHVVRTNLLRSHLYIYSISFSFCLKCVAQSVCWIDGRTTKCVSLTTWAGCLWHKWPQKAKKD